MKGYLLAVIGKGRSLIGRHDWQMHKAKAVAPYSTPLHVMWYRDSGKQNWPPAHRLPS